MDVSNLASLSTSLAQVGTSQAVDIAVLKKALEVDAESATALIEAIPAAPTVSNLPAHLGQHINTTA